MTADAPDHEALSGLVAAAARMPDHGSLKPWRLVELRGRSREELGSALVQASLRAGRSLPADARQLARLAAKPLRAPLLIAIVAVHRPSPKVTEWEQDIAAAGVAHALSLLLDDAGWGVMWRTGRLLRSAEVRALHRLGANEHLLGWLYVGGRPVGADDHKPRDFDLESHLSAL